MTKSYYDDTDDTNSYYKTSSVYFSFKFAYTTSTWIHHKFNITLMSSQFYFIYFNFNIFYILIYFNLQLLVCNAYPKNNIYKYSRF